MAVGPYNPVPQVGASAPAGQYENIQPSPAEFGGLIGGAEQKLGGATEQAGDVLAQNAVRIQTINNETAARNTSNKYIQDAGQAWAKYGELQGKAAVDAYPQFVQQLQDIQQQHADTLQSPQARNDFLNASSFMLNRLTLMSSTHAAQQQQEYWKQSHVANIENMTQTGVFMQNDPMTVETSANSIQHSVETLADMNGWDPERSKAETSMALGKYYRTVIEAQAATDPTAAMTTFERARGRMDGVSQAEVERSLRSRSEDAAVARSAASVPGIGGATPSGAPGGGAQAAPGSAAAHYPDSACTYIAP